MFVTCLRWFCRTVDLLVKYAGYFASALMPLLAAIVAFEVFSRYFLNRPTVWAFDFSLFLFGYIAIIGGAFAQQKGGHITVDILYKKVSVNTRRIFDIITFSVAIFFLVLIVYICFDKAQDAIKFGTRRQSEWAPPMLHFWIMTISACSLFILQLCRDILENLFVLITGNPLLERQRINIGSKKSETNDGN
ncbi:TRAP transporter small permease subunit [Desulfosediminicola sp.]|uniref:TRAP transporter small permease subunit n=1 Tax=Desulfosediminicola sp. TaxID=2886825 RepID=UPI003AF2724E